MRYNNSMMNEAHVFSTTVVTDPNFWDCECRKNYIQPKGREVCEACGFHRADAPDARANEVASLAASPNSSLIEGAQ